MEEVVHSSVKEEDHLLQQRAGQAEQRPNTHPGPEQGSVPLLGHTDTN
jgi:hypothetical protein